MSTTMFCMSTHRNCPTFQATQFQIYTIQKKNIKTWNISILEMRTKILSLQLQRNEKVTEEYCWEITLAAGWSCCCRSGSSLLESGLQMTSLVYTRTVDHICTKLQPAQNPNLFRNLSNVSVNETPLIARHTMRAYAWLYVTVELHIFLSSALYEGEWSVLCCGHLTLRE